MRIEIAGEMRNFRVEVNRQIALMELCNGQWCVTDAKTDKPILKFQCEDGLDAILRVAKYLRSKTLITSPTPFRQG